MKLQNTTRNIAAFAALLFIGAAAPSASARQGSGGGTISYTHVGIKEMWTMNSEGSNQTKLGSGTYGPVSTALYNNRRWFLDTRPIPDQFYPDGGQRVEVFALRDDYDSSLNNNGATRVQLTDDIALQPLGDGLYSLDWVPGDQEISFKAQRWSGGAVTESGIYTALLQLGADGNIIGLAGQPTTPAIPFALGRIPRTYCWDHMGTKIAYEETTGLFIADRLGNPHQQILNGMAHTPRWSPDGTKIAFSNANGGISTIKPNATGLKQIIARTSVWNFDRPYWSPTGSHIVCYGSPRPGQPYNLDLFRATATGGRLTNLTNTPPTGGPPSEFAEYTMGWR